VPADVPIAVAAFIAPMRLRASIRCEIVSALVDLS
jgi:hypothetical protein